MSNLINFNFQSQPVRTITDAHGEVWFVAGDVCNILGYANSRKAINDHCKPKGVTKLDTPTECDVTNGYTTSKARKSQEMTYINEPNLYRLIIKSRKPEAEKFEEWVMEEVLPSIRKTGSYHIPNRLTSADTLPLRNAVNMATSILKLDYATIYKMIHQRFGVDDIKGLTHKQIPLAVEYVHSWIVSHKRITNDSLYYHIHHLVWNTMHAYRLYQESEELFSALSPKMIGDMPSFLTWAKSAANDVHQIMGFEFDKDHPRQIPSMSQSFFD